MAVDRSTIIHNAQRFMARGQIDKAIEEWQKLVALTPQDGNLYNTIGDLYLKKNDTHHAIEAFMLAATAFERAGFALKTVAVYKKILKIDPSCLEVNLKLADLNAERGLTGNAIEDYLKVAKEYGRRGKVQEALEIYRKIANFDPSNTNIRLKLAELSLREKLTSDAIDEYTKVAQIYEQNGRAADAAAIYKKILEINPKHAGARDALKAGVTPSSIQTLPTVDEIEEAVAAEDWEMAGQKTGVLLLHEPANLRLRHLRGKILLHKGEAGLAWADYRALVEDAARVGRIDEGIALLREYRDTAPPQAESSELFAKLLDQAGRTHDAIDAYAALIDVMTRDGSDETQLHEHFIRMKALDPASDVTRRYQARFEPATVAEQPAEVESVAATEIADAAEEEMGAVLLQEQEAIAADVPESPAPAEPPRATRPMAPEPATVEGSARSEPSVEIAHLAESSRSRREPSVPPPPPLVSEQSASLPRSAGSSQSRSRGSSATPPPQPAAKRLRPRDISDYFAEADVYLKYGLAAKAIEQYKMVLSIDLKNMEAHARLRELYQLEGRIEEAVTHSVLLARLYHARGQQDQAEQVLSEAREWNPADPRLQEAIEEQGPVGPIPASVGQMASDQQEATPQRPKQDLQEWLAEAEFYLQQGLDEQAHQLFETIRQHYPAAPEVVAYFETRQAGPPPQSKPPLEGGLDELADVLNQSGAGSVAGQDDHSLSAKLADLFPGAFRGVNETGSKANDRLTASVEGVIRAVEQGGQPLPPDGPDPHYSLGLAYKEMGLHAEARKEFEQALRLPAYQVDAAMMIAACHQAEGQPRQAIRQLEECLGWLSEQDAKWLNVAYELAALAADVGDQENAMSQLQRVLAVDAGYEPAVTLLQRLKESPKTNPPKASASGGERAAADQPPAVATTRPEKEKRYRISYV